MLRTLPTLFLTGCCCCWPFGGGGGDGGGGMFSDMLEEELAEQIIEGVTGAEQIEVQGDTLTVRGPDGEVAVMGAGAAWPSTLALTAYPGATVVSSISVSGTHTVTAQTPDGPDAVEAHYQPQIAAFGEVQRADFASGDGGMRSLSATGSDGRTASLVIMTSPGEPTTINVSVTTP